MAKRKDPTRKPGTGQWKKGVSGNPGGRRTEEMFKRLITLELNRAAKNQPETNKNGKRITRAESIVAKLCDMAEDGDLQAVNFIVDRVDGKPKPSEPHNQTPITDAILARSTNEQAAMQQLGMRYGLALEREKTTGGSTSGEGENG